MIKKVKYK